MHLYDMAFVVQYREHNPIEKPIMYKATVKTTSMDSSLNTITLRYEQEKVE